MSNLEDLNLEWFEWEYNGRVLLSLAAHHNANETLAVSVVFRVVIASGHTSVNPPVFWNIRLSDETDSTSGKVSDSWFLCRPHTSIPTFQYVLVFDLLNANNGMSFSQT